jgi:Uma2 family endonuclease
MVALTEKTLTSPENQVNHYSPEEYLTLEEKAETKHEYHNGKIIEMAGATINHNRISGNIYAYLNFFLRDKESEVFVSDVKVYIPEYNVYTYPDVMMVADKPIYQEKSKTTILNPLVIIEVLSLSTQDYDRGQKFKYYRSVESLQEYILIDQYESSIEQFAKNPQQKWVLTEYKNQEETLKLESLSWQIPLKNIYKRVDLSEKLLY